MKKLRQWKIRGFRHAKGSEVVEPFETIIPAKSRKEATEKFWWTQKQKYKPIPRWNLVEIKADAVGRSVG